MKKMYILRKYRNIETGRDVSVFFVKMINFLCCDLKLRSQLTIGIAAIFYYGITGQGKHLIFYRPLYCTLWTDFKKKKL